MQDSVGLLRSAGLRVTAVRVAVLEVLRRGGHPTAEEIGADVRGRLGSVSQQAVYDVLRAFVDADLAASVEPAGSPVRYEARVADNHHHVVCRGCGAIADSDCAVGVAPCLTPSADRGFVIEWAEVLYWGLCPSCQQAAPRVVPGPTAGGRGVRTTSGAA
jgi:Fur family ferric uptake transcriptional regulator